MPTSAPESNTTSDFKLKASYWYITHKLQLKKALIIFLIASSVILYGYSLYRVAVILFWERQSWQESLNYLSSEPIDYAYWHQVYKPKDLQISGFSATSGQAGRYDFIVKVKNPNTDLVAAAATFQLLDGGAAIAEKTGFIYPGEEKYVIFFGQQSSGGSPAIKIAKTDWQRVRSFDAYAKPRLQFLTSEIDFKSARESGIRGELPVSTLSFKLTNNSGYSYWSVGVYMILLSGQGIAGANYLALDQFLAGETRTIEMRWYEPLASVSGVEILPEVDVYDPAVFMPVQ